MKGFVLVLFSLALFFCIGSSAVWAARGDLLATYSFGGRKLAHDAANHRVYVSDTLNNRLQVVDTRTLASLATISVGTNPMGLAVSQDGSRVYTANNGSNSVSAVNTSTLSVAATYATPWKPWDMKAGVNNWLYITPDTQYQNGILTMDATTGAQLSESPGGDWRGMVEISPDRTILFYGSHAFSPGGVSKGDVTVCPMLPLNSNPYIGSYGRELTISHNGQLLYYGVGGNLGGYGYWTDQLNATTLQSMGTIDAGQMTCAAFSPTDQYSYTISGSNGAAKIWNTSSLALVATVPVASNAWDIVVDETGTRLFVVGDNALRVYDTGFAPVPEPSGLLALVLGLGSVVAGVARRMGCARM